MSWVVPPVEVLMSFPEPNYVNPPTLNGLLLGVDIPFFAVTTLVVVLRFMVRKFMNTNRRIEADDWLILIALVFAGCMTIENCGSIRYGWCKHIWDVHTDNWEILLKLTTCTEVIFGLAIGFTKFSILAFYSRVFSFEATSRTFRICLYTLYALETIWVIINICVSIFQCLPVHAIWDISVADARCNNLFASITSMAALNSLTDVAIFALPIPWVWKLCLPKQQKLAVIGAFGLGFIVIVAGFVRMYYLKVMLFDTYDLTWHGTAVYATTAIEVDLGIICASVPALKAFFLRMFNIKSTHSSTYTNSNSVSRSNPRRNSFPRERGESFPDNRYNMNTVEASKSGEVLPAWVTNDVELGDIKKIGNDSSMSLGSSLVKITHMERKASDISNISDTTDLEKKGRYGSV